MKINGHKNQNGTPRSEAWGHENAEPRRAFTLIELLVVISILGLLAAIAMPTINGIRKPNVMAAATRQLMDDLNRARQLAISQRTTVYMIFAPTNFWNDPNFTSMPAQERNKGNRLFEKQFTSYAFVSLRQIGEQPGRSTPKYLSSWKTLPEGVFIPLQKFTPRSSVPNFWINDPPGSSTPIRSYDVFGFPVTNNIPFPSESAAPIDPLVARNQKYAMVPYIAFNYLGQLVIPGQPTPLDHEVIPLSRGNVNFVRNNATREVTSQAPTFSEAPAGNFTNTFNLVYIEGLTGRAHIERLEVK